MKHYDKLIKLESQIIDADVLTSVIRALATGLPGSRPEDVENTMWHLSDRLESIHAKLREQFNELFDAIRDEEKQNETKARKPKAKKPV